MNLKALNLWRAFAAAAVALLAGAGLAQAEPYLVADAETGQVMIAHQATEPWFPASTTKLMTTYVALAAVRDGRLTMDTPLTMSRRAARSAPSKMGFKPGTLVTLDNALKMLMVKSPNDVAVMVAEGVSGSVEAFADEMNATAQKLGLHESHFVNPNGLHDPNHWSSARDMAMIARALLRDFPEHNDLYGIGAIQLGSQIITNHNGLIGRYPGADGMKTGFTCAAGFNVVATAARNGRRLIVVVFGSPSARERTNEAAQLFDAGFGRDVSGSTLDALPGSAPVAPPDMKGQVCLRRSHAAVLALGEDFTASAAAPAVVAVAGRSGFTGAPASAPAPALTVPVSPVAAIADEKVRFDPIPVFVGPKPGWNGPVLAARDSGPEPEAEKAASPVTAYAPEKDAKPADSASAKSALVGSVKPAQRRRQPSPRYAVHVQPRPAAKVVAKKPHP